MILPEVGSTSLKQKTLLKGLEWEGSIMPFQNEENSTGQSIPEAASSLNLNQAINSVS